MHAWLNHYPGLHETQRFRLRIGTAAGAGGRARARWILNPGGGRLPRRRPQQRAALAVGVSRARPGRAGGPARARATPQAVAHPGEDRTAVAVRRPDRARLRHGPVDGGASGRADPPGMGHYPEPAVPVGLAARPRLFAPEARAGAPGARPPGHCRLAPVGVGADKKNARRLRAPVVFVDESGLLMAPLVRRTWAPRGHRPVLRQRGRHREKVSLAAAL